jgi:hypothetical protein
MLGAGVCGIGIKYHEMPRQARVVCQVGVHYHAARFARRLYGQAQATHENLQGCDEMKGHGAGMRIEGWDIRNWLISGVGVLWLSAMVYALFNPAAADGSAFFHHLSKMKIESIDVTSLDGGIAQGSTVEIVDKNDLDKFIGAWRGMDTFLPNHPKITSSDRITFHTSKGRYSGVLQRTSNQGVMFIFDDSPTGWPVSRSYQLVGTPEHMDAVLRSLSNSRITTKRPTSPPHL